ncbi:membrane protein [Mycolicibacter algericus]|uniref:Membrane protein n=1 Tax=Mycolicibacter algericus TaxID=1288388 RepID=A0A7I9YBN3_MYCAL|nr:membrane protein [Mycolicibacter algericus]
MGGSIFVVDSRVVGPDAAVDPSGVDVGRRHDHPGHRTVIRPVFDAGWHRAARWARRLAWVSLLVVGVEGVVGIWQGLAAGSIALTGWALGAIPEALAGAIVIWRFTGARTLSETAERRAQIGVAVSFWINAPYIAAESVRHLFGDHRAESSLIGIALTSVAVLVMPVLGRAQRRLGTRLGSAATVGEGVQNYLCAIQAAAVLVGLTLTAQWAGGWWLDPLIGLAVAAVSVWQGFRSWRGEGCGC